MGREGDVASVTEVNATGLSRFVSAARAVQYMLCCQALGDTLGTHLGMQRVHDSEDSEDGKGGSGVEGGSRARWQLSMAAAVPSSWASWMVVEAMGMSWDTRMFDKWSVHAPCTDHERYKSPATHGDLLGHPIYK